MGNNLKLEFTLIQTIITIVVILAIAMIPLYTVFANEGLEKWIKEKMKDDYEERIIGV